MWAPACHACPPLPTHLPKPTHARMQRARVRAHTRTHTHSSLSTPPLQLERKGYYIVDQPLLRPGKPIVLFNIPDGRQQKS